MHSISSEVADNVRRIREQIVAAANSCGRDPSSIHLIAVSKRKSAGLVRAAFAAGVRDFGENYLQESLQKIGDLRDLDVAWHFIGSIQSNKTRPIAEHFQWVHTVSNEKIARRLDQHCPAGKTLDICLQVNVDRDPQKAGVAPEDAPALLARLKTLPQIRPRGLMTILRQDSDPAEGYARLARLWAQLRNDAGPDWDSLSMGMSGDFQAAIAAGATHVRVGTAIFGARD